MILAQARIPDLALAPALDRDQVSRLRRIAATAAGFSDRIDEPGTRPVGPPDLAAMRSWLGRAAGADADQLLDYLRRTGRDPAAWFRPVEIVGAGPRWYAAVGTFVASQTGPGDLAMSATRAADILVPPGAGPRMTDAARAALVGSLTARLAEACQHVDLATLDGTAAGWMALLTELPGLSRVIGLTCRQWADGVLELFRRLDEDWALLRASMFGGTDPGPIVSVRPDAGDRHAGGRSVTLLGFASGDGIVYKAKDLSHSVAYQELVAVAGRWLPDLPLSGRIVLPRHGYGWEELIRPRPCADRTGFAGFYRRLGVHLALLQLLGGRDMWADNLIAQGDQPMFIDLECLLHQAPAPLAGSELDSAAQLALNGSVVATSLVVQPWSAPQDLPVTDVGCLSTAGDVRNAAGRPLLPLPQYRPYTRSEVADPTGYAAEVLAGYRAAQDVLVANRELLTDPDGPLAGFRGAVVRHIRRNTWDCYKLIGVAVSRAALRGGWAGEERLAGLLRLPLRLAGTDRPDLIEMALAEIDAVQRLDIPLFAARSDSRQVFSAEGRALGEHFHRCAWDELMERAATLDGADLAWQRAVLRSCVDAAVEPAGPPLPDLPGPALPVPAQPMPAPTVPTRTAPTPTAPTPTAHLDPPPVDLVGPATEIGEQLVAAAIDGDWIGQLQHPVSGVRTVDVLGPDLHSGVLGLAVYLAELAAVTADQRFADAALATVTAVGRTAERVWPARSNPLAAKNWRIVGGFDGPGAAVHAMARIGRTLRVPEVVDAATELAGGAAAALDDPAGVPADAPVGWAGLLLNLLTLRGQEPGVSTDLDDVIDRLVQRCATDLVTRDGAGFSGAAGGRMPAGADSVVMALARAGAALPHWRTRVTPLVDRHRFDLATRGGRLAAADTARSGAGWTAWSQPVPDPSPVRPGRLVDAIDEHLVLRAAVARPVCTHGAADDHTVGSHLDLPDLPDLPGRTMAGSPLAGLLDSAIRLHDATGSWLAGRYADQRITVGALDGLAAVGLNLLRAHRSDIEPLSTLR